MMVDFGAFRAIVRPNDNAQGRTLRTDNAGAAARGHQLVRAELARDIRWMPMKRFSLESLIDVETLPVKGPLRVGFVATPEELADLCERFGYMKLDQLQADLELTRVAPETWDVTGRVQARLVQPCIVTGDPVPESVDFEVEDRYVRPAQEDDEVIVGLEDSEPLVNGCIDLGELVAQSLALAVNAWPRTEGAPDEFKVGDTESPHPFAGLGSLKLPEKK